MDDYTPPPANLRQAVAAIWRLQPPGPDNLFSAPTFVELRETCQSLYANAGSKDGLSFALANALRTLGLPCHLTPSDAHLVVPAEIAAARLDVAFRRTQSTRVHLCPLDCADDIPTLNFGPNSVRRMEAAQLKALVDPQRLRRINRNWKFDADRFSEFTWLVVREVVSLEGVPGARAVPFLFEKWDQDFGAIEPHAQRFTSVVEAALFAMLLAPWEEWAEYRDFDWRGFRIPWSYTVDDDLFGRPAPPPSPDTLSWEPDIFIDGYGEQIELERPTRLPLNDGTIKAPIWVNDTSWSDIMRARQSPLFDGPIAHFLVHGFMATGIDEFLAHITVIEAALGLSTDYDRPNRPKLAKGRNPGATVRVAARLSALLGAKAAGDDFRRLFDVRSQFLHGRTLSPISGQDRVLARRLARDTVVALIKAALTTPAPSSRDAFLCRLLDAGSVFI